GKASIRRGDGGGSCGARHQARHLRLVARGGADPAQHRPLLPGICQRYPYAPRYPANARRHGAFARQRCPTYLFLTAVASSTWSSVRYNGGMATVSGIASTPVETQPAPKASATALPFRCELSLAPLITFWTQTSAYREFGRGPLPGIIREKVKQAP